MNDHHYDDLCFDFHDLIFQLMIALWDFDRSSGNLVRFECPSASYFAALCYDALLKNTNQLSHETEIWKKNFSQLCNR